MLLRIVGIISWDWVEVEERGFGGIALFSHDDGDPDELCFVLQHLNKTAVRDLHKRLIVATTHLYFLFPALVESDHQRPDPLAYQEIDDATACRVQVGLDAAITLRRNAI
jgi:hypothetical protein